MRKLNRQAMRVESENPVNNVVTHTSEVVETQNINITATGDVNIQVTKTTVKETRQEITAEIVELTSDDEDIHIDKPEPIIIESDSDDYEIFDDVEIEEGDVIIELGLPEIDPIFLTSESESETESSDSEDDIPLVNLNKRKISPIIRSNLKKARGN